MILFFANIDAKKAAAMLAKKKDGDDDDEDEDEDAENDEEDEDAGASPSDDKYGMGGIDRPILGNAMATRLYGFCPIHLAIERHHHVSKLCQMLLWQSKTSLHSISIRDFVVNMAPLCSVYQAPLYEPSFSMLTRVSTIFFFHEHVI